MKILVDTHYLLWSFIDTGRITTHVKKALLSDDNEVYYSQASLWEIAIKIRLGKMSLRGISPEKFYDHVQGSHFKCRRLENEELISFYKLPIEHKDPFDRIMIWQAIRSGYHFLSVDKEMTAYAKHGLNLYDPDERFP